MQFEKFEATIISYLKNIKNLSDNSIQKELDDFKNKTGSFSVKENKGFFYNFFSPSFRVGIDRAIKILGQIKEWMSNPLGITQNNFFDLLQQARGSSKVLYTRLLEVQAQSLGLDLEKLSDTHSKIAVCGGPDLLTTTYLPFVNFLEAEIQRELSSKVIPLASLTK